MEIQSLNDNQRRVLDVIWRSGPISRVDIASLTGLSQMSVTRVTRELADKGLILETVNRAGARGQPTRPLSINADAGISAGVYFSEHRIQVGIINLGGACLATQSQPVDADTPKSVAGYTSKILEALAQAHSLDIDKLIGVGFALPGDFIQDRKRLNAHALFPGFRGDDIHSELQSHLDLPVSVENDAACAALGERLMGIGQNISHFMFAHIGHGIGGGLILNGELYRGAKGNAGIIGVQFPNDAPRPSGQDLLLSLREAGVAVNDFDDLEALRPFTCPPLRAWLQRASAQLRQGLWISARLFDPDAVIIGGRLPSHLLQEIVVNVDDESFCNEGVMLPRPKLLASSLGPRAGLVGAAAIPLYDRLISLSHERKVS